MDKKINTKTDRHMYKQSDFDYIGFGDRVRIERAKNRMTQTDLANEVRCVRSTISRCERGGALNPAIMFAICMRFDINILDYCTKTEAEV